jgi:hypothetical protein
MDVPTFAPTGSRAGSRAEREWVPVMREWVPVMTAPAKDAGLYRKLVTWAAASAQGELPGSGRLAGVSWLQQAWFTRLQDGSLAACIAGAASLLAGAVPADPWPSGPSEIVFRSCRLRGGLEYSPAVLAGARLGLAPSERIVVFAPGRSLNELISLVPAFDADAPLAAAGPEYEDWLTRHAALTPVTLPAAEAGFRLTAAGEGRW